MPADLLLQRLARTSAVVCLLMAVAGYALGGTPAAVGVVGGGLLIGVSFYLLGSGAAGLATLLAGGSTRAERRRIASGVALKLAGRYALLAFLAYVMIARLRLHPLGVLAGASSVGAAAFIEAVRFLTKNRPF